MSLKVGGVVAGCKELSGGMSARLELGAGARGRGQRSQRGQMNPFGLSPKSHTEPWRVLSDKAAPFFNHPWLQPGQKPRAGRTADKLLP